MINEIVSFPKGIEKETVKRLDDYLKDSIEYFNELKKLNYLVKKVNGKMKFGLTKQMVVLALPWLTQKKKETRFN